MDRDHVPLGVSLMTLTSLAASREGPAASEVRKSTWAFLLGRYAVKASERCGKASSDAIVG